MEVHAHTHTSRKKWTHYFWEFFMLFLAVTLGFFVENQREHMVEHRREKQYMRSMLEDLASDTAALTNAALFAVRVSKGLDSLQKNIFNTDSIVANTLTIYRQNAIYTRLLVIQFSDQTATQLRNSGTMRLIRKREIANAISGYWKGINGIENIAELLERRLDEISAAGYNIFNRGNILKFSRDSLTRLDVVSIDPAARLMTVDKNTLINYANQLNRNKANIDRFFIPNLTLQKLKADSLIHFIKKEYHLK